MGLKVQKTDACPTGRPFGVVDSEKPDGKPLGCFPDAAAAGKGLFKLRFKQGPKAEADVLEKAYAQGRAVLEEERLAAERR